MGYTLSGLCSQVKSEKMSHATKKRFQFEKNYQGSWEANSESRTLDSHFQAPGADFIKGLRLSRFLAKSGT